MSNLKVSQLEKITNMKEDSFVLAIQNGKNYKMSVKEAMNSYIDLSNYYTKEETVDTIEAFEVVSDKGNTTTIGRLFNTVETQGDKITELIAATDNAQSTADNALANAATAQFAADAAQDTANSAVTSINTINNTTIPGLQTTISSNTDLINTTKTELQTSITSNTDLINTTKTELQTSITSNTDLINTTKTELIGTENTDGTTIWGAKKYTDDLVNGLSSRIDSIVAGGIAFKGVVATLPSPANNGDLVIMSADYEIDGKTYKKDYEYVYSNGTWYELGDSDKNAKAIANVKNIIEDNELVTATALTNLDARVNTVEDFLSNQIISISYIDLKTLIDNAQLVPGQQYRITDYQCTTTQENTRSAGHAFDIIVTADTVNTFNEVARAVKHDGDDYFANSDLNAWKLWYSLDNDTDRFVWADVTNGKGVIYRMIDEWNNDIPYDFKNIQYNGSWGYWAYTFNWINDDSDNSCEDLSVAQYVHTNDEGGYTHTYDNIINPCEATSGPDYGFPLKLNACVFLNTESYDAGFYYGCSSNTFGSSCYDNTFGSSCYNNTFGSDCYSNTFGDYYSYNSFGNYCSYIKFASDKDATTKYNYYQYNHFGDGCKYIIFTGSETASDAIQVQNYNFSQGLQGTYSSYLVIDGKRNRSYETYISKDTDGTIKESIIADKLDKIIETTYANLVSLRDSSNLIPGQQYRITDYTCTTTQSNTKSAGHVFDIIVTADDKSTLNELARAVKHEGDEYFANNDLSAWQIWYSLDNDTNRFAWADEENGKGVIYRMIDEWNNDIPYDFKNIQFLRVDANTVTVIRGEYYNDYSAKVESLFNSTKNTLPFKYQYLEWYDSAQAAQGGFADLLGMTEEEVESSSLYYCILDDKDWVGDPGLLASVESITANSKWLYTFNTDVFNDSSLDGYTNNVYSNEIGSYSLDGVTHLNNICFLDNNCSYNTFGSNCFSNTFGPDCRYNSFGSACYYNTFGPYCSYNTFGSNCSNNTFGSDCSNNTFGSDCYHNIFGSYCRYNIFGSSCSSNTVGPNCSFNSLGDGCSSNTLGTNSVNNTFGSNCYNIKFASDKAASTKYSFYQNNHFGDGCKYILFKGSETASSSAQVQNYNFAQGLRGTSSVYLTIDGVRNLSYEAKVAKNSKGELKIYCEADLIR